MPQGISKFTQTLVSGQALWGKESISVSKYRR